MLYDSEFDGPVFFSFDVTDVKEISTRDKQIL